MMARSTELEPYLGSRPFDRTQADRKRFFGRARETEELSCLVLSHNLVLVYAASGAGKSSLLNAGVVPELVAEGFDVLPRGRVGVSLPAGAELEEQTNPYVRNLLASLSLEAGGELPDGTLADYLRALPRPEGCSGRVIVIDQAEELFTFTPRGWQIHQREFFLALRGALRDEPDLRIIIVTREDYLAHFESFAGFFPGGLGVRFRLEPLGRSAAREAVEKPLAGTCRQFDGGVAEQLVLDLAKTKISTGAGVREEPGPYVEPVQLQIVCSALWSKLPASVESITAEHLQRFGDVEETLEQFYRDTVAACVDATGYDQDRLALWFGTELITPADTRGQVFRGPEMTGDVPNEVVDFLEARHVLHADERASGRWYELAHDRLIRPIRTVNEQWKRESDAVEVRGRTRRKVRRLLTAVLCLLGAFGVVWSVVLVPRLAAQAQERALTVSRIEELRAVCAKEPGDVCNQRTRRVFDFIADYYWRQEKTRELVAVLKGAEDLIPSSYGMPRAGASGTGQVEESSPTLRIEYNPDLEIDTDRTRSEWVKVTRKLASERGLPLSPHIMLVPDRRVSPRKIRVIGSPQPCFGGEARSGSMLVEVPERNHGALISRTSLEEEPRLEAFFEYYSKRVDQSQWKLYAGLEYDGPWWFVPAWTLPIWRVGGVPAVSREALLVVAVTNVLLKRPELVFGCDALVAVLRKAYRAAPETVIEALSARHQEVVRLDFIELARTSDTAMLNPSILLDSLAEHPSRDSRTVRTLIERARTAAFGIDGTLHGPWAARMPPPKGDPDLKPFQQTVAAQEDRRVRPIVVELGPDVRSSILDGAEPKEVVRVHLQRLRGALYQRYGVVPPEASFRADKAEGIRILVLDPRTGHTETHPIQVGPGRAAERLLEALEARYSEHRASWVTAEQLHAAVESLHADEKGWLEKYYSLTDLKRIARAALMSGGVRDGSDTLRDLPWLLRSLSFWVHVVDPMNISQVSRSWQETQRARQSSSAAATAKQHRVVELVGRGLELLSSAELEEAAAHFAMAIGVDRDSAIATFLAAYPALSALGPARRVETLSKACRDPRNGSFATSFDLALVYEMQDLLRDKPAGVPSEFYRYMRLCVMESFAVQQGYPLEVRRQSSALLLEEPVDAWAKEQRWLLAKRWLLAHRGTTVTSTELARAKQLLVHALSHMSSDSASRWLAPILEALRGRAAPWSLELITFLVNELPPSWVVLRLGIAEWLAPLGARENEQALAFLARKPGGLTYTEEWQWEFMRAKLLGSLSAFGDAASRMQRLDASISILRGLTRASPLSVRRADAYYALAEGYVKKGEVKAAREAVREGVERGIEARTFDDVMYWMEIGEGRLEQARLIAQRRSGGSVQASQLFLGASFALLTRSIDLEDTTRSFIFDDRRALHASADLVLIMLAWRMAQAGRDRDAEDLIKQRVESMNFVGWPHRLQQHDSQVWQELLVAMWAGELPPATLLSWLQDDASFLAAGLQQTGFSLRELRCKAYFYIALYEQVTGQHDTREQRFLDMLRRSLANEGYGHAEHSMAQLLIRSSVRDGM